MPLRLLITAVILAASFPLCAAAQDDRATLIKRLPEWRLFEPLGSADVVSGESVLPLQFGDTGPITGRLAFSAQELLSVKSADGSRTLEVGKDVKLDDDGKTLVFAPDPKLLFIKESEFFPPKDSPMSYRHRAKNPEQNMLYSGGSWFHERQMEVKYRRAKVEARAIDPKAAGDSLPFPEVADKQLPRTIARLQAGQPITLGFSGDSITAGGDASGLTKVAPHMPPYPQLVAAALQARFHSAVTLRNRAVGGWSVANGVQDLDKLLAEKPHLIVVAYGMNDVGRRDPTWFKDQTKTILDRVRAADPEIEVILVAPMLGNAEWVHTPREMFAKYRDELASLTGPGVALADLTAVWSELLKSKHDYDLIGNGLNHPNDCGHRLYAQTILALLAGPE